MIVVYAEKEDMGIRYAVALGGIEYSGKHIDTSNLNQYMDGIKRDLAKNGYLETTYNNKKYIVTWGWGHFGTLKDIKDYNPEYEKWKDIPLPFIPKKYEVKRIQNSNDFFRKRDDRQFNLITRIFNSDKCEFIINATDWEREGELIFAYVYDLTGSTKPYYRLRNTAKTEKEIRKAFDNLVNQTENYPYVLAARARSIADWTIGINMTIAATLYLSKDRSLMNIGRVMTPTLNLIVQREKEIRDFKEETNYGIKAEFILENGDKYEGKMEGDLFKTENEAKSHADSLNDSGIVTNIETKVEKKKPPLLYSTNTLQIEANEVYGYTLEQTLNIAQKLYENGYITYPRVDSQYLTEDKKSEMPMLLAMLMSKDRYKEFAGPTVIPERYFDNSKVDGHDAIIITDTYPTYLTEEQANIYDLIARRVLMTVGRDMSIEKTVVLTDTGEAFKTLGTRYLDEGWNAVSVKRKELNDTILPKINKGDKVTAKYSVYDQTSKPPQRFTDATLVKAMENCGKKVEDKEAKEYLKKSKGIGRPATRAALVERLIKAGFIERKKKLLIPTEKGIETIDSITIEDIKSPLLTADWEKSLDEIEFSSPGDCVGFLRNFLMSINSTVKNWCSTFEANKVEQVGGGNTGVKCPKCGLPLIEGQKNYFCSGYKNGCNTSISKLICGKKISVPMLKELIEKRQTKKLKSFKSAKGKPFDAKLVLLDGYKCTGCGAIQENKGKCYKCGGSLEPADRFITGFKFE